MTFCKLHNDWILVIRSFILWVPTNSTYAITASLTLFFVNTRTFDFPVHVRISFDKPCQKRPSFINNIKLFRDEFSEDVQIYSGLFLLVWWDLQPSNAISVWSSKATFKKITVALSAGYVIEIFSFEKG